MDRNDQLQDVAGKVLESLSARRAWIEILYDNRSYGSVTVALRKESVDRNIDAAGAAVQQDVALRKESVDRNTWSADALAEIDASLSARRAWIEISISSCVGISGACRSPQGERG